MRKNITWYGQSAVKIKEKNILIYIDPYNIPEENIELADVILLTHHHQDHCSLQDINKLLKKDTVIIGPKICEKKLEKEYQIINIGEKINIKGIEIEAVPAYNINKQFHPKKDLLNGYIITTSKFKIYHPGDTDDIEEMNKIDVDIAFLPVSGTYVMDPLEAAKSSEKINAKLFIPFHYGAGIVGSIEDAINFKKLCNKNVQILEIGKEI